MEEIKIELPESSDNEPASDAELEQARQLGEVQADLENTKEDVETVKDTAENAEAVVGFLNDDMSRLFERVTKLEEDMRMLETRLDDYRNELNKTVEEEDEEEPAVIVDVPEEPPKVEEKKSWDYFANRRKGLT
jgi:septal ring factor EnvC (AmiA/AmiB activator)